MCRGNFKNKNEAFCNLVHVRNKINADRFHQFIITKFQRDSPQSSEYSEKVGLWEGNREGEE